jgi:signal transduction histidine kinase
VIGYLLVASDWSAIGDDLRNRTIGSIVAALGVLAIVSAVIPVVVRRYVSQPLGQLSAKVTEFSSEDGADRTRPGGEVELITEEFRRLDRQLTQARSDLTERHRRELELERRLQRADRLATIGTLAAGLAHEIGTPMGVIRGRAQQLLAKEAPHTKAAEALEIIIAQIDRVSGIVRTLLDYARPRDLRRIACDIRPLAERTLRLVETEARQRNVALVTELGDAPLFVECDPDQIEQVFVNLAMNALDAMSAGGGTLRIAAAAEAGADADQVSISFHDTGPGIPAQHRARVFDAFFTTKEPGRGTGMGLAVSLSIVHDHKGDITLESDATGTTFTVTMPLAQARSGRAKPAAVSA